MNELSPYSTRLRLDIVRKVVSVTSEATPADSRLREVLRSTRGLDSDDRYWISQAVFSFYRWRGWVTDGNYTDQKLFRCLELDDAYSSDPDSIPDSEIMNHSVPGWVREVMEVSVDWLRAIQTSPVLWLRSPSWAMGRVESELNGIVAGPLSNSWKYQGNQDLLRSGLFHDGCFEIQDISSQAVGWIARPVPGQTWWDACAGEGGKTLHLSDLMQNKGLLWASDAAAWRLERLKRRAGRAKVFNYRSVLWGGTAKLPTGTAFDGVLVDAPCSGIGTWQRNPHARWTLKPGDVDELSSLQLQLLSHAARAVKPGGRLVYSVCTLTNKETAGICGEFEVKFPGFKPEPFEDPLSKKSGSCTAVTYRPQDHQGQGMHVASWTRVD